MEDSIYKMLRNEFIITNNRLLFFIQYKYTFCQEIFPYSAMSLFSIPSNKRFVYYNTNSLMRRDPLLKSISLLQTFLQKPNFKEDEDDFEDLRPFKV